MEELANLHSMVFHGIIIIKSPRFSFHIITITQLHFSGRKTLVVHSF